MLKELLYSFVNLSDRKNNGWHCSGLSYCLVMAHAWPLPHIAIRFRSIWSLTVFITQGAIPVPRHFTQLLLQFAMWWVVNGRDVDPHGSTIFSSLPTIYHETSYDKNCVKCCGTNITFRALASDILKKNAILTHQKITLSILTYHFTIHFISHILFLFQFI